MTPWATHLNLPIAPAVIKTAMKHQRNHVAEELDGAMTFFETYDKHYDEIKRFIDITVKDAWIADDLTQETFLRVENALVTLKDPTKIRPWIFRIAYNLCQDHFRTKGRTCDRTPLNDRHSMLLIMPSVEKTLEQKQMGACVQDQMGLLPDAQKTVLELFDIMGLSQKEIADVLDITIENVKVRLHRARRNLKEILNEKCVFERDERDVLVCVPRKDKPDNCK